MLTQRMANKNQVSLGCCQQRDNNTKKEFCELSTTRLSRKKQTTQHIAEGQHHSCKESSLFSPHLSAALRLHLLHSRPLVHIPLVLLIQLRNLLKSTFNERRVQRRVLFNTLQLRLAQLEVCLFIDFLRNDALLEDVVDASLPKVKVRAELLPSDRITGQLSSLPLSHWW